MAVKLQVRLLARTVSVPVRGVSRFASRRHGHIADRAGYSHDLQGSLASSAAIRVSGEKRSVKPSA
jgi:hypothetical protein